MALPLTTPMLMSFSTDTVHLEISSKCVLKCPRCPRTELDLPYLNQEISLDQFARGFPPKTLASINTLLMCGHTGDPIYATELLEIIDYIKNNSDCNIRMVTNGSYKKPEWWQLLGSKLTTNDEVIFSVDGWDQQSNNQYRVNSDFNSITQGIKFLRNSSDCIITWSFIYFSFNSVNIDLVKNIAINLGCDYFKSVKSSKFDNRYQIQGIDPLKPNDKFVSKSSLYEEERIPLRNNKIFSIGPKLKNNHPWAKCLNHAKEIFVNVQGIVQPCAWFDGYQINSFLKKHRENLSIYDRSLTDIINDTEIWSELFFQFDSSPLPICQIKCKNVSR